MKNLSNQGDFYSETIVLAGVMLNIRSHSKCHSGDTRVFIRKKKPDINLIDFCKISPILIFYACEFMAN